MTSIAALFPDEEEFHLFRRSAAWSALFFVVAAFCSVGFHHPDEFFQTIQFAGLKLGNVVPSDLAWEYEARLRSWLQPALYVALARGARWVGVQDAGACLTLFRLFSALTSWCALWSFVFVARRWFANSEDRARLYRCAAFLCFLPYLAVRTSGETLSAAALAGAIAAMETRRFALGGALCAVAFGVRFPSGAMAAGIAAWYLRSGKLPAFVRLVAGALPVLIANACLDRWGYGEWTVPVGNYLRENFLHGKAKEWGTSPFFAYLYFPARNAVAPIGIGFVIAAFVTWWRKPKHPVTWATAPYFALISITAHKETRFLFPFAPFLPFFFATAFQSGTSIVAALRSKTGVVFAWIGRGWNAIALVLFCVVPARPEFLLYRHFAPIAKEGPTRAVVIDSRGYRPYDIVGLRVSFFDPKNVTWTYGGSLASLTTQQKPFYAFVGDPSVSVAEELWLGQKCQLLHSSFPEWALRRDWFRWQSRTACWRLYRCR